MIQACTCLYSSKYSRNGDKEGISQEKILMGNRFHVIVLVRSKFPM